MPGRPIDSVSAPRFETRQEGIEPPTYSLEGCCSIQLSYWRFSCGARKQSPANGGRKQTTQGLLHLRRQMRYDPRMFLRLSAIVLSVPLMAIAGSDLPAQTCPADLPRQFAAIARTSHGTMGIAAQDIERNESAAFNASEPLPMQSVFKLPVAIAILSDADHGRIDLAKRVVVTVADLAPGASPMASTVATEGHHAYTIRELLDLMAGQSDNTAADALIGVAGGARHVQRFLSDHGLAGIDVSLTETEMAAEYYGVPFPNGAADPLREFEAAVGRQSPAQRSAAARTFSADPRNTATAAGLVQLLVKLQTGTLLSPPSSAMILGILTRSTVLPGRLKGLLPPTAQVAHKSGTSATTDGVTAATNDIGVITMPDHSHVAIAVLLKDASAPAAARDSAIARVAKTAYDCWSAKR
jgi:beta-lactamase class A